jgi:hypothetical protein
VLRQASDNTARLLAEFTRGPGTFADRIRHFAHGHLRYLLDNGCLARLILRELTRADAERGRAMVEGAFGANFTALVAIFRTGQMAGHVRQDLDPAVMALALFAGNVFFFQSQPLLPHLAGAGCIADPDHYCSMVVDVFLHGVLAAPT